MKKIVYICMIILINCSLFSCDHFLTEEQYDFIGPDLVGDSESAKEYWINGIYYTFNSDYYFRWGGFTKMWEMDNDDITGPDWAMSAVGVANFQGFWASDYIWNGPYQLIHRANQAIPAIENMTSLTEESKNDALGQIYFLRAFAYFQLVRAYGPVPVHSVSVSKGSDPNQPRKPVQEVYALIIEDLKKAETMMYSNKNASYQMGRPGKGAASLLLAKVYVTIGSGSAPAGTQVTVLGGPAVKKENGTTVKISKPVPITHSKIVVEGYEVFDSKEYFRLAREKALEVINSGEYDLFPTYSDIWKFANKNTVEHVFSLQSVPIDEVLSNTVAYEFLGTMDVTTNKRIEGGWCGLRTHWYEIFEDTDKRIIDGVVHRWTGYAADTPEGMYRYYPEKDSTKVRLEDPYFGYKKTDMFKEDVNATARLTKFLFTSQPGEKQSDYHYPWLRFSEALLIFAEADNEVNGGPSAEAYRQLNRVRTRSEASEAPVMNQQEFRSFVLEERRREFALEGNRRWDLIRWGIYIPVMNAIDIDENSVVKRRENKQLLFPIPVSEIDANKAIDENNPGW